MLLSLPLMKTVGMKAHPQAEIESGYADTHLATCEGKNRAYTEQGRFERRTDDARRSGRTRRPLSARRQRLQSLPRAFGHAALSFRATRVRSRCAPARPPGSCRQSGERPG